MTTDHKIRGEKLQYVNNRDAAKISTLPCRIEKTIKNQKQLKNKEKNKFEL